MSELKVSAEFRQSFLDASRYWLLSGYTEAEIDEIKRDTRYVLQAGGEIAELRQAWVADNAGAMRQLDAMASGMGNRILAAHDANDK